MQQILHRGHKKRDSGDCDRSKQQPNQQSLPDITYRPEGP